MKLNEVLAIVEPTGAKISGREESPDGDGWILYIGRLNELVYPFATMHCMPISTGRLLRQMNPNNSPQGRDSDFCYTVGVAGRGVLASWSRTGRNIAQTSQTALSILLGSSAQYAWSDSYTS